jgi:hypothetical protein
MARVRLRALLLVVMALDLSACTSSPTVSPTTTTTVPKPLPAVDLSATPTGWVPVAYGDVQVSVPADWWVFVHDCMTVGASMPGVIFVNPLHETRTACRGGLGKIPKPGSTD